ncbi:MAG: trans-sialidase, partial [Nitrosopumilaceae archaeon]
TTSWTLQKSKITGYTAPSNQYFANKQRLAYKNPASSFTGYGVTLGHGQTQTQSAPPPPPPPQPQPQQTASSGSGKSKKQLLEEYEKDYLARMGHEQTEAATQAQAAETKPQDKYTKGLLPKGS